ncbi:MAG TPA: alpha/beta hydrolase domain-containing protein, partial [Acidimicrobiales bacterium]|nr:alpha/beta hydrolase domain-containing protein [Acidimicrobiales bacterium]
GNVLGGVRSPQVDAPIATLGGVGNSPAFCSLFGTTVAFSFSQVASLYPTHAQFVSKWEQAAQGEALAGYLVPADVTELDNAAAASWIW